MKQRFVYLLLSLCSVSLARGFTSVKDSLEWKELTREKYTLHYTSADQSLINKIDSDLRSGLN